MPYLLESFILLLTVIFGSVITVYWGIVLYHYIGEKLWYMG